MRAWLLVQRCVAALSRRGRCGDSDAEVASPDGDLERIRPLAKAEIAQGKELIAKRVEDMQRLTEAEVLACGTKLSAIFDHVGSLISEGDSVLADSTRRYEQTTSRFVSGMQQDGRAQEAAATQVLHLAQHIEGAIGAIDDLTRFSNLLAINSRIEAARIGQQGRAFTVLADRMRELSGSIQGVADQVKAAIAALRESIPPVMERTASMHARTRSFIDEVAAEVRGTSQQTAAGGSRLDRVMQLSNESLSNLQFQDRLQQQLVSINRCLDLLDQRVHRVLDGELQLEAFDDAPMPGDGVPGSGAVLLF